jgi:hypothetical protein
VVAIIYGTARHIATWPACSTWHPIRGISLLNLNVQFFHVYRHNNTEADAMANRAIEKDPGLMGVDGVERLVTPP